MEDAKRPEEVAREKELEARLRRQYDNPIDGSLPTDLVSAALEVYNGIVQQRKTSVRLSTEQFLAVSQNPRRFTKCVIFLLVYDLADGKSVPLIAEMWLLPELGRGRGWVRVNLWLPKKPSSLGD